MIQFEVGKSYKYGNTIYTVAKRSAVFISFSDQNGNKFRAKPKTGIRAEYEEVRIKFCLIDAKHDLVCSQPEPATAEITTASDNDNAMASQPANVATTQSNTTALQKITTTANHLKYSFVVGVRYISAECVRYTVINRSANFITLKSHIPGATKPDIFRKKIIIAKDRERINLRNENDYILANWIDEKQQVAAEFPTTANDTTSASDNSTASASQPEIHAPAESLPPENLYDDDSFSDAPGDNSCPDMDIPECHTPDSINAESVPCDCAKFIPGRVYISPDNRLFTVINRSENFCTLADDNGNIFRRKIEASANCESVRLEHSNNLHVPGGDKTSDIYDQRNRVAQRSNKKPHENETDSRER